jgi:hypothetical protein
MTGKAPNPIDRMQRKRILVLSVSAGSGHVRAAQALCAAWASGA